MSNISNIFKSIRKELGLTQTEFALSLNVSRSAIAQIESSNNNPSNELVKRLITTHRDISVDLISQLKRELNFTPDIDKKDNNAEIKYTKNSETKELLSGIKLFQKTMSSLEYVVTLLSTRFYTFTKDEVEVLKELDELILVKPFKILLGKSSTTIEEYEKELNLKSILAEELLHDYIRKLYEEEFNLKEGENVVLNYDSLLPDDF